MQALTAGPRRPFRDRLRTTLVGLSIGLLTAGCNGGEDSWLHYQSGGLFLAGTPSLSPDGTQVVYASPSSGHGDIFRVNRDGTGRIALTSSEDFESQPVYSHDGSKIAFVREHDGYRHIWVMNADGSGQTQLTSGRILDDLIDFSPDGKRIVFERSTVSGGLGRFTKPYLMDVDGGNLRSSPEEAAGWGRTSPDGEMMLTTTYDSKAESYRIWLVGKGGFGQRLLGNGASPVFSRDGKNVFYLSSPYARDLCVIDINGKQSRMVRTPAGTKTSPRISYDGKWVLIGIYSDQLRCISIYIVDIDNLEVQEIAQQ